MVHNDIQQEYVIPVVNLELTSQSILNLDKSDDKWTTSLHRTRVPGTQSIKAL